MGLTRITSDGITDAAIVNADINASAAIAGTKIDPSFTSGISITNTAPSLAFVDSNNNNDFTQYLDAGVFHIRDTQNSQNRFSIASDGTITVQQNLDVGAGIDVTGAITGTGDLTIDTNTLHVDSSNNRVGIGTTSPSVKTQISVSDTTAYSASTISANQFQLSITNTGAAGVAGLLFVTEPSSGNGGHCGIRALSTGSGDSALTFSTRGSSTQAERLRIDSSGRLQIGSTNNSSTGTKLVVGSGNNLAATALINTQDTDINALTLSNWDGATTSNKVLIGFDNSGRGSFSLGMPAATNALAFFGSIDGSSNERMRIDSSGNVGIGDNSPDRELVVKNASSNSSIKIEASNAHTSQLFFSDTDAENVARISVFHGSGSDQNSMLFGTAGSTRLAITSAGKVGIGTISPTTLLEVKDTSTHAGVSITADNASTSAVNLGDEDDINIGRVLYDHSNDSMQFQTNNTERMRIGSNGFVAIGMTSTDNPLSIQAMTNARVHFRAISDIQSSVAGAGLALDVLNDGASAVMDLAMRGASIYLRTNDGESVRINRYGFVKMKGDMANHLSADGNDYHEMQADNPNNVTLRMRHGSSNGYGIIAEFNHAKSTHFAYRVYDYSTGTSHLFIRTDGDLENTNNSYGQISDVKLKENIVDAKSQWNDIKALKVRNFNFKSTTGLPTHKQLGLVAQEAEAVCPGIVKTQPDRGQENEDLGTETKSIKYSVLYMKAVKALQEAQTRIETLETKVAALEAG